jgi:hypothetical protein
VHSPLAEKTNTLVASDDTSNNHSHDGMHMHSDAAANNGDDGNSKDDDAAVFRTLIKQLSTEASELLQ